MTVPVHTGAVDEVSENEVRCCEKNRATKESPGSTASTAATDSSPHHGRECLSAVRRGGGGGRDAGIAPRR